MRLVLDTNVLVSALLHEGRIPHRAVLAVRSRGDVVLYDARIVEEYREVLSRPKFRAIDASRARALIADLVSSGEAVHAAPPYAAMMTDEGDRAFVEIAIAGRADALVTGNVRHYPTDLGFEVLPPAVLLARFGVR